MKGNSYLGVILAIIFLLPAVVGAQVTASISGTVQDTSGAVIPGAALTVKNLETGGTRSATADERGYYRALSLPVGRYEVAAEKPGFKRQVRTGVNLVVGQEAVVNLSLELGEVQQEVTVTAESPIVNTTTASVSGLVGEREIKDLPLNGRSFDNLIMLNPGTSGLATALKPANAGTGPGNKFNIAGRRSGDNLFLLNGIEYTGTSNYDETPGGASGQLLGIDAVREFNVQANTYGAEYGKRSGGQISVVTMSGTNQLHGTIFEFLRNSALDARNFFDISNPPFRRNDFGAAAGGPIRKDKTFIFGNYEGYRQSLTTTNIAFVPDANARQGLLPTGPAGSLVNVGVAPGMAPYFAIFPAPNGPELGGGIAEAINAASNPVREDFGTVRVDQLFSASDTLSGAYTVDDGIITTPSANPFSGSVELTRNQVVSLDETHTFSPNVLNTVRAGFSRANDLREGIPLISLPAELSMVVGQPMGGISVGGLTSTTGGYTPIKKNLFTYTDSVQIVKGKHVINVGAWFQRVQMAAPNLGTAFGTATFAALQHFLQGQAASFSGGINATWRYSFQWEGAWYAQDTVKIMSNLTMNFGLRHEFTDGWNVHPGPSPVNFVFGPNGVLQTQPLISTQVYTANNSTWLFGPRVGLAWDPFGKGRTSVRAGFGTYHNLIDNLKFELPQPNNFALTNPQFPLHISQSTPVPQGGVPKVYSVSPPDIKTPTVQEWSLTIEQQLTPSTGMAIGYVGSHGYHVISSSDENPAQYVICSSSTAICPANLAPGTLYIPPGSPRLNPALGSTISWSDFVYSKYEAVDIDLNHRLSRGLSFRTNYTYSKAMDNGSQLNSSTNSNCNLYVMDIRFPNMDYSPACFDVTQRFVFSGSYELPIGGGQVLLGGVGGLAGKLLSGWQLNTILAAQTGFPLALMDGFNQSRNGQAMPQDRPSQNPNFSGPVMVGTPNQWFNPHAYVLPPSGTYGNLARESLRAPGITTVDLSLFKNTHIGERGNLEFRAEVFNLLNHANFGIPGSTLFSTSGAVVGGAGVITKTLTTSRQIQFGLKLYF